MNRLFALIVIFAVAGCASDDPVRPSDPGAAEESGTASGPPSLPPNPAWKPTGNGAVPQAAQFPPREPTLIPGDLLDLSVYLEPDLKLEQRIPEDGHIVFPLAGDLDTTGLTSGQLAQTIKDKLAKDYLHDPHVTVTVKEYAVRKVYILGGVEKPDGYILLPHQRVSLMQLVSAAGGITDKANKEYVQIVRRNGADREVIRLSLYAVEAALAKGQAGADLELWPDDLVVIPSAARVVYVLGAVKEPGWFDIPADTRMTASMAISRAGSYTKFAATGRIQVLRQTPTGEPKKIEVDLDQIVKGKLDQDVVLEPGDVVWVPERGLF